MKHLHNLREIIWTGLRWLWHSGCAWYFQARLVRSLRGLLPHERAAYLNDLRNRNPELYEKIRQRL